MNPCRLRHRGKNDQRAVFGQGITITVNRILQGFVNHVVGEKAHQPRLGLIKYVQHILSVGRADHAAEQHVTTAVIKRFVLSRLQIVATGKNNAVILRQLHTGRAYRIYTLHFAGEFVEHQIAPRGFAIGQNFEQDQTAEFGVPEFTVVDGLVEIVHWLAINTETALGVVFNFYGEVAANGFNKNLIDNIDVRMFAVDHLVAGGLGPFKIKCRRQLNIALAAIIDVGYLLGIRRQIPAEHPHIAAAFTDLKCRQQFAVTHGELHQMGVFVVAIQLFKIPLKRRLGKKSSGERNFLHRHIITATFQTEQRKNIGDAGFGFQADKHVIAEQQNIPDLNYVTRDAIIFRAHAYARRDRHFRMAEFFEARLIE